MSATPTRSRAGRARRVDYAALFIIGDPVMHSLSPEMQGAALARAGIRGSYVPVRVAPARLAEALEALERLGFTGGNITLPPDQRARRQWKTATMTITGRHASWPGRLGQESVILRGQLQDLEQPLDRVPVRPVQAPFQVPQAPHAQLGTLGQLLLGQTRRPAVPPEQLTEQGRLVRACRHRCLPLLAQGDGYPT